MIELASALEVAPLFRTRLPPFSTAPTPPLRVKVPPIPLASPAPLPAVNVTAPPISAGVEPPGKRGPHVFRHARAVELLRASVPQKIIGDVLGHRSTESTNAYLKLATEDLRAVALDVPGSEVLS